MVFRKFKLTSAQQSDWETLSPDVTVNKSRRININRMDSKREVSQVFDNSPQGSRLRGRPKNRWWNCVQAGINIAELQIGKTG
jgi:hypothetical protein